MNEIGVTLPVLPLMPQQEVSYNALLSGKKHFCAISAHRRFGKDVLGISVITSFALKHKGTYFYVAPFRKQVREIIIEGERHALLCLNGESLEPLL